jgi:hypothetical protein
VRRCSPEEDVQAPQPHSEQAEHAVKVYTVSGTGYEIDLPNRLVRRMADEQCPQPHSIQRWYSLSLVSKPVHVGSPMVLAMRADDNLIVLHRTGTVVRIVYE